jgi:hypothetical protein
MNRSWLRLLCAGALALTSLLAHAQYSWVDDKGARVFSDRPPPPDTPAERILKAPRGFQVAQAPAAPAASAASAAESAAKTAVPTWTEREADYRKRAAERDKAEQEAETKRRKDLAAQCSAARADLQQLTTSRRLARGSQLMSDDDRARELEKVQRTLQGCS